MHRTVATGKCHRLPWTVPTVWCVPNERAAMQSALMPKPRGGRPRSTELSPFGERLRALYMHKFGTKAEFLRYMDGMQPVVLDRYESGIRKPPADFLERCSEAFDVSVDYLLLGPRGDRTSEVHAIAAEELPASELAIRLLRPMAPEVEAELREFVRGEVRFSTGADVAPIMWQLEQKKRAIEAAARERLSPPNHGGAQAEKPRRDRGGIRIDDGRKAR